VASKMGFSLFWQPATLFREQKFLSLLMKQETMRQQWHWLDNWKSFVPCARQITIQAPHHSIFALQAGCSYWCPTMCQCTEGGAFCCTTVIKIHAAAKKHSCEFQTTYLIFYLLFIYYLFTIYLLLLIIYLLLLIFILFNLGKFF